MPQDTNQEIMASWEVEFLLSSVFPLLLPLLPLSRLLLSLSAAVSDSVSLPLTLFFFFSSVHIQLSLPPGLAPFVK